jgi:hypothetical protein
MKWKQYIILLQNLSSLEFIMIFYCRSAGIHATPLGVSYMISHKVPPYSFNECINDEFYLLQYIVKNRCPKIPRWFFPSKPIYCTVRPELLVGQCQKSKCSHQMCWLKAKHSCNKKKPWFCTRNMGSELDIIKFNTNTIPICCCCRFWDVLKRCMLLLHVR